TGSASAGAAPARRTGIDKVRIRWKGEVQGEASMKKDPSVFTRVNVLIVGIAFWGCVIGARLFFLHVVRAGDYKQRAERQQQRAFDVTPSRGVIYDRHKNELAISIKVDSVFAVPEEIEHPAAAAKILSRIVGLPAGDLLQKFQTQRSFVWIKRKL